MKLVQLVLIGILSALPFLSFCQGEHGETIHEGPPAQHIYRVALYTGTTLIPTHIDGEPDQTLYVPTYGIEVERRLLSWLGVGVTNEIELQNYILETKEGELINRSFIYVASVVIIFQPFKRFLLYTGPGIELTSDHNFSIWKVGAFYGIPLTRHWDIAPQVAVDQVSDLYTSFTFGLSIGKKF